MKLGFHWIFWKFLRIFAKIHNQTKATSWQQSIKMPILHSKLVKKSSKFHLPSTIEMGKFSIQGGWQFLAHSWLENYLTIKRLRTWIPSKQRRHFEVSQGTDKTTRKRTQMVRRDKKCRTSNCWKLSQNAKTNQAHSGLLLHRLVYPL